MFSPILYLRNIFIVLNIVQGDLCATTVNFSTDYSHNNNAEMETLRVSYQKNMPEINNNYTKAM